MTNDILEQITWIKEDFIKIDFTGMSSKVVGDLRTFGDFLNHPKLHEKPRLVIKMTNAYQKAKQSGFKRVADIQMLLGQIKTQLKDIKTFNSINNVPTKLRSLVEEPELNDSEKIKDIIRKINSNIAPLHENLAKKFCDYLENQEFIKHEDVIEDIVTAFNKVEKSGFKKIQHLKELLPKLELKLKLKGTPSNKLDLIRDGIQSPRLKWTEKNLRKLLRNDENIDIIIEALINISETDLGPALETLIFNRSKEEKDRKILRNELQALAPFLNTLSGIKQKSHQDEITIDNIKKAQTKSFYVNFSKMAEYLLAEARKGNVIEITSAKKLMTFFFPEKQVTKMEDMTPTQILRIYSKSLDIVDIMDIPEAKKINIIWLGIANFVGALTMVAWENPEDTYLKAITKELENLTKSLAQGHQIVVLNRSLEIAAKKGDMVEVVKTLNIMIKHIQKDIIGKINNDLMPLIAKAKLGQELLMSQEEAIKDAGIDFDALKWKKGIDITIHQDKEKEMHDSFDLAMDKIQKYFNGKAREEASLKIGTRIQDLNKFFNELKWGWNHPPTASELQVFNVVEAPILSKVKEAEKHLDNLIETLITILLKSPQAAKNFPITIGLKDDDHDTSVHVRNFLKKMEHVKEDLLQLIRLNEIFSRLSGNMRLIHKNLPSLFIQNPKFIENPTCFLDPKDLKYNKSNLHSFERRINMLHRSNVISDQEFETKSIAISKIKNIIEENKDLIMKYGKVINDFCS